MPKSEAAPPKTRAPRPPAGDALEAATPMVAQYLEIKQAHPDCLLFYRMGDFYELFFDDAVAAAKALDITLTRRGKHEGRDIPMCGVPVHAADGYLARLVRQGFRVAVAEQTEDPAEARQRGGKALVRREVVRVVTAGTLTEDSLLDARRHNYLAALAEAGGELGLAWLDLSTGDVHAQPLAGDGLAAALARLDPGEMLAPERLAGRPELGASVAEWRRVLTPLPDSRFDSENARRRLMDFYRVDALEAFGAFTRAEIAALGALIDYVELTQKGRLPRLAPPRRLARGAVLVIDPATIRNLEIFRALSGERKGSLLWVLDRTVTGAGARMLAARLGEPLTEPAAIAERLEAVQVFVDEAGLRRELRGLLARCPDAERALSRLTLGRGGPRDLAAVRDALETAHALGAALGSHGLGLPKGIEEAARDLGRHDELTERLTRALGPELPLAARDGGFIAAGFSPELDEQRTLRDEGRRLIAGLQSRYSEETGISSLKVRHNNVLGYFVEVPSGQAPKMPSGPEGPFIHRQTMASAVRYTTTELAELESRIAKAADAALALELALFEDLAGEVAARAEPVARAAHAIAALDVASALALLAVERGYCRPVVGEGLEFRIKGGRHPVVEAALEEAGEAKFVANDCDLSAGDGGRRLWLLTGPNMAGKSTFLRQNALIAIMAQMGSFVPADEAAIGAVDRLFSRVGAADDIARGRSTFMVEMVETAAILNQAGSRALVILDEIGRGTATFDGLSIAWAVIEHLHELNRCRGLFATHYHELTALSAKLSALGLYTMRVKEWRGDVVFLHEVAPGVADRSYGIHVGRLAGLPQAVVERAEKVLETLETDEQAGALTGLAHDLPLFSAAYRRQGASAAPELSALEEALAEVSPDALTPKEALELLYRLKELAKG